MSTGVQVDASCITEFNEFKLRGKYRYMVFHVANNQVVLEKTGAPDASYDSFLGDLPADDCRYAVFNFEYDAGSDGKRSKVVFFLWAPETSKIKSKMIYAGTKDTVKKAFQGLQVEIQATDKSETDKDAVLAKCQSVSK